MKMSTAEEVLLQMPHDIEDNDLQMLSVTTTSGAGGPSSTTSTSSANAHDAQTAADLAIYYKTQVCVSLSPQLAVMFLLMRSDLLQICSPQLCREFMKTGSCKFCRHPPSLPPSRPVTCSSSAS